MPSHLKLEVPDKRMLILINLGHARFSELSKEPLVIFCIGLKSLLRCQRPGCSGNFKLSTRNQTSEASQCLKVITAVLFILNGAIDSFSLRHVGLEKLFSLSVFHFLNLLHGHS